MFLCSRELLRLPSAPWRVPACDLGFLPISLPLREEGWAWRLRLCWKVLPSPGRRTWFAVLIRRVLPWDMCCWWASLRGQPWVPMVPSPNELFYRSQAVLGRTAALCL